MPKTKPMHIEAQALSAGTKLSPDLVVVGVFDGAVKTALQHPCLSDHAGVLQALCERERFVGRSGQRLTFVANRAAQTSRKTHLLHCVLVGMGAQKKCNAERLMALGGTLTRTAEACAAAAAVLVPPAAATLPHLTALAKGAHLGLYRYNAYKGDKAKQKHASEAAGRALTHVVVDAAPSAQSAAALHEGAAIAMAVRVARDLVNCPPNDLYPESFAAQAQKLAKTFGVKIAVFEPRELNKMGMGMLMGVGQGSERLPRLVHISYCAKGQKKVAPTLLVGKGITFDSGGLCIKSCDGMNTMKMDMGGAAAVLATVLGAAALKLDVHVHGVLALAENMPSGHALRTGDVLKSAQGLTVEVNNTDAEGRLVLGDALHFGISRCKPARVVDVATLTGACMVALGSHTTGLFSNDDALAQDLLQAFEQGGEHAWRLPLTETLADQLRSDVADMRNTGDRLGGAITAALFLQRFVGDVPWAHLDIAGPAWAGSESATRRKGGTGAAVCSLMQWLVHSVQAPQKARTPGRRPRDH